MLSDFDLAKQFGDPGIAPAMVHSEQNGVSTLPKSITMVGYGLLTFLVAFLGPVDQHHGMHIEFPDELVRRDGRQAPTTL